MSVQEVKKTIRAARRLARLEPAMRLSCYTQAIEAFFVGDSELGKKLLRMVIAGEMGYEVLARRTTIPSKSIHRMLSPRGNPTSAHLFTLLAAVRNIEGFRVHIEVTHSLKKGLSNLG